MGRNERIEKALSEATPAGLLQVSTILHERRWETRQWDPEKCETVEGYHHGRAEEAKIDRAIEAFERGEYGNPDLADSLNSEKLGEALR